MLAIRWKVGRSTCVRLCCIVSFFLSVTRHLPRHVPLKESS